MHLALMGKHPNVPVVACIDIFTTFKPAATAWRTSDCCHDFGDFVADWVGNVAGMLLPLCRNPLSTRICRPIFLVRHQEFGEFPKRMHKARSVFKFPCVVRAIQLIDVLFEPSTIDPSGPCSARLIRGEIC
jgi:hypothetical protein